MSRKKKNENEFLSLGSSIIEHCIKTFGKPQGTLPVAKAVTRLGKTETIYPKADSSLDDAIKWIHDSVHLRLRQNRYSSVAIMQNTPENSEGRLLAHFESENGDACRGAFPYKVKRLGTIAFGEPEMEPAEPIF